MSTSEVARLLQQIDQELEAAQRGLYGLSAGSAKHEFINQKMDRAGQYKDELATHVGEVEAARLLVEHYIKAIG